MTDKKYFLCTSCFKDKPIEQLAYVNGRSKSCFSCQPKIGKKTGRAPSYRNGYSSGKSGDYLSKL